MAIDPTLSEQCFRRSVKKYFVDNLYTIDGIYLGFETEFQEPEETDGTPITEWINFHFDGLSPDSTLGHGRVAAYLFTRGDTDGSKLSILRDKLMEYLLDLDMPDGIRRVPLYDLAWQNIGGMLVSTGREPKEERGADKTLYKFINIYFRYATK